MSVLAALVLIILIDSNTRIEKTRKKLFILYAAMLLFSSVIEYLGVYLDGTPVCFRILHICLKVTELSLSPFITIILITTFNGFAKAKRLFPIALINLSLEILTGFTGFMFYVDSSNFYHHNTYYSVYTIIYIICGIYFFHECVTFSRQYQNRNVLSLLSIIIFLIAGLSLHTLHTDIRADWLTLIIGDTMFYIYYNNLVNQMDSLTKLLDRKSYDTSIRDLRKKAKIIIFDVDNFKSVNDTYGHEAGDICLSTVSDIIKKTYGKYGLCYRMGGDEFCVISTHKMPDSATLNTAFCSALSNSRITEKKDFIPNVSIGYSDFNPSTDNITDALKKADEMMYEYKKIRKSGKMQAN